MTVIQHSATLSQSAIQRGGYAVLERTTIYQAARRLGISESAVRQRIHRGTLESGKDENGRLIVYLPPDDTTDTNYNGDTSGSITSLNNDYITILKSQIESLQQDKEALQQDKEHLREESARKDHIILSLTQRIPAIEAPAADSTGAAEPRESVLSDSETEGKGAVPQDQTEGKIKPPWWQRWFGGGG